MKKILVLLFIACLALALFSCSKDNSVSFDGKILETYPSVLVEPEINSIEYKASDKIVVHINDSVVLDSSGNKIGPDKLSKGQLVSITYNGMIAESYPAQIWATKIQLIDK